MDKQLFDNLLHASVAEANIILKKIKETYYDDRKDKNDHRFEMIISALAFKSTETLIILKHTNSIDVLDNMIKEFYNKT